MTGGRPRDSHPGDRGAAGTAGHPSSVRGVSHAVDPKTRSMPIELDVRNTDRRLASGMYPSVKWPVRKARPALLVPPTTIASNSERTFVVRVKNGVAEWVDVKKGTPVEDLIEVYGPLQAGDEIVRRGSDEIHPGTKLNVGAPAMKE